VPELAKMFGRSQDSQCGVGEEVAADNHSDSEEEIMSIEERKMSRPDSRWKAEILNLYRTAESQRSETDEQRDIDYQTGVMMACLAIWDRVTGEQLV
jgi:hypothetical protein